MVDPKYTTQQTVESKLGTSVHGWKELLESTGFHFINPVKKDVSTTIVFPEHDDSGLQRKTQKYIEALLGVPPACLKGLAALCKYMEVGKPLLTTVRGGRGREGGGRGWSV